MIQLQFVITSKLLDRFFCFCTQFTPFFKSFKNLICFFEFVQGIPEIFPPAEWKHFFDPHCICHPQYVTEIKAGLKGPVHVSIYSITVVVVTAKGGGGGGRAGGGN